jgi:hypothetical protein
MPLSQPDTQENSLRAHYSGYFNYRTQGKPFDEEYVESPSFDCELAQRVLDTYFDGALIRNIQYYHLQPERVQNFLSEMHVPSCTIYYATRDDAERMREELALAGLHEFADHFVNHFLHMYDKKEVHGYADLIINRGFVFVEKRSDIADDTERAVWLESTAVHEALHLGYMNVVVVHATAPTNEFDPHSLMVLQSRAGFSRIRMGERIGTDGSFLEEGFSRLVAATYRAIHMPSEITQALNKQLTDSDPFFQVIGSSFCFRDEEHLMFFTNDLSGVGLQLLLQAPASQPDDVSLDKLMLTVKRGEQVGNALRQIAQRVNAFIINEEQQVLLDADEYLCALGYPYFLRHRIFEIAFAQEPDDLARLQFDLYTLRISREEYHEVPKNIQDELFAVCGILDQPMYYLLQVEQANLIAAHLKRLKDQPSASKPLYERLSRLKYTAADIIKGFNLISLATRNLLFAIDAEGELGGAADNPL